VEGYSIFVENSKPIEYHTSSQGGIGLDNLNKRLNYIYPGAHELIIINEERKYCVTLNIDLNYAE
jgi:LytS/YehU family sensor histidine kinase